MEEKKNENYIIVTPGTLLATSEKSGEGIYKHEGKTYSKFFGILKKSDYKVSVIPFRQYYTPVKGDKVIGKVKEFNYPFFIVDIDAPNPVFLYLSDASSRFMKQDQLMKTFKPGTWIYSEISELSDRTKLSMKSREAMTLKGGRMINISPSKVPRVIGKSGSMIKMIQDKTNCKLMIGQNGVIWIEGERTDLVIKIINKIDEEAHISGLTDRISLLLEEETKNAN